VRGPNFLSLYNHFDDLVESLAEHIDTVAERIVMLGGIAEGTLAAVSKRTMLAAYLLEITSGQDQVEALSTSIATVGRSMRAAIDRADGLADANTADLVTGISRDLDKQLWLLEAHIPSDSKSIVAI
jgi:starvation-inducible DNA-binding protein